MAVSFQSDPDAGVVVATCTGALGESDAKAGASEFWEHPEWRERPVVWDFRAATFDVDPSAIRSLAKFILDRQPSEPPPCVAFVTGRDVDFGLSRMFQTYREDPRTKFWTFRDFDEAVAWARSLGSTRA